MRFALWAPNHWHTWFGLGLLRLIQPLSYRAKLWLGRCIGRIFRLLPLAYIRIARCNIDLCFPKWSLEDREKLLSDHCESLGTALCESVMAWWGTDQSIRDLVVVEGAEHLAAAKARGKGVILVGGHFTTIEFATRVLSLLTPLSALYRPPKNKALAAFFENHFERHIERAIPYDDIRALIRALKQNGAVWYAPDQSYRNKGAAMVRFFGVPAATTTATSRLAKITGASVITYFPQRLPGNQGYKVLLSPALQDFPTDDVVEDSERFNRLLEAHIERVPSQYMWMHRRFKGLSSDYPDYYGRDSRHKREAAQALARKSQQP